jgi:hypothetical protein
MRVQPPGPSGAPPEPEPPDYDLHELSIHVRALEQASNLYRTLIRYLTDRVVKLESGQFPGDVAVPGKLHVTGDTTIDAILTVRDDIILPSK